MRVRVGTDRKRTVAAVAAAAVGAVVLAGCGSTDGGAATEQATAGTPGPATATATPSPGAVPDLSRGAVPSVVGVPVTESADGPVVLGSPEAPIALDVYEDFLCEACGQFSQLYDQALYAAITGRQVSVRFHPIALLDGKSASKSYSTRAAAASRCVAQTGDAMAYSAFRSALFRDDVQPAQGGSSDHDDTWLAALADEFGADEQATQCISSGAGIDEAGRAAEASRTELGELSGGQAVTPSVYRGSTEVRITRSSWLRDLLAAPATTSAPPTTGGR